ncbi:glycoside hydrolase family 65 protein [Lichenicoccus roseus]|uniref:Glycoside hydrolase family 65 protein n=1 Tax=Lichenicoccus roseus TaxID=2683649 RepID=A0A5R9JAA1_9PROT|nr:glycosyl hydrolase family 65 protein [Lichenicoccus roseus]TLU74530.1 glycoside hydrolase family 65 protein [Lichenicoccus roseus]
MIAPSAPGLAGTPDPDPAWALTTDGFDALREGSLESRYAIGNGLIGVRGARAATRGSRWLAPPRTYVAGLFDTPERSASSSQQDEAVSPGLVPAADWLHVRVLLDGHALLRHPAEVTAHRMTLDMRGGALLSRFEHQHRDRDGGNPLRLLVHTLRLTSQADRSIGLQVIEIEVLDGEAAISFEASFEGVELGLVPERIGDGLGEWRTHTGGHRLAIATRASLAIDGGIRPPSGTGPLRSTWQWRCLAGEQIRFERTVAVVRSDGPQPDPGTAATRRLANASDLGTAAVMAAHRLAWDARWTCSAVEVGGDPAAQRALRFALYHLNSAANPDDGHVSIGARALTGDGYRGHVFWDTEIYLLPFYSLTWPAAARAMLMYRYRTLDGARAKAAGMGWQGALYAWESADSGAEATPLHAVAADHAVIDILCGKQEQHISADVAFAVWQYWQATGDEAFLLEAGAEILLETARFWSSRARLEADGRSHIRGVIGPDEYHEHVDDSAFTNVMARWNIRTGLATASLLRDRWPGRWASLSAALGLEAEELARWGTTGATIVTGLDPATGLYEQFAGYNELEQIDLADYAGRSVAMDMILGRERIGRSQVVKQADIVALLGLLPQEFAGASGLANFRFYEPRCSHGSSLSRAMHAFVAARLGLSDLALRYFRETADIDLGDNQVACDGGIHIAALGGIWLTAVFGFAGLSLTDDGVALDPQLPPQWTSLAFSVQRGRCDLHISIGTGVDVAMQGPVTLTLRYRGAVHVLQPGQTLHLDSIASADRPAAGVVR